MNKPERLNYLGDLVKNLYNDFLIDLGRQTLITGASQKGCLPISLTDEDINAGISKEIPPSHIIKLN